MLSPVFSIIVPVYNVELFLKEALDSLLMQTFTAFEVILVNDGSTDKSGSICKFYSKKDARFTTINQPNLGLSEARNEGFKRSKGKYIYFFDSDDVLEVKALELWHLTFKSNAVDLIAFNGKSFGVGAEKYSYTRSDLYSGHCIDPETFLRDSKKTRTYTSQPCLFVSKRNVIRNIKFFPEIIHEDELFYLLLFLKNVKELYVDNGIYFHRRLRANSIMMSKKSDANFYGYMTVVEQLIVDSNISGSKRDCMFEHIKDLVRQMVVIAQIVDGGIVSNLKRLELFRLGINLIRENFYSKTILLCFLPELRKVEHV